MYDNTTMVRKQAIKSDSVSEFPAFSPRALAHIRQINLELIIFIQILNRIGDQFALPYY